MSYPHNVGFHEYVLNPSSRGLRKIQPSATFEFSNYVCIFNIHLQIKRSLLETSSICPHKSTYIRGGWQDHSSTYIINITRASYIIKAPYVLRSHGKNCIIQSKSFWKDLPVLLWYSGLFIVTLITTDCGFQFSKELAAQISVCLLSKCETECFVYPLCMHVFNNQLLHI